MIISDWVIPSSWQRKQNKQATEYMERTEIEEKVRAFLIDDLEIDEDKVFPESRLKEDMGIDSLDYVDIVAVVLSTFGVKVNIEKMKAVNTLSQFIDYLETELKQK